jgi:phage FluMu protein Com
MTPRECRFCGSKITITGYGEDETISCPTCKAIIHKDRTKQVRCTKCGKVAYKVNLSPDGYTIFFVHDIKIIEGEIKELGHKVYEEGFR